MKMKHYSTPSKRRNLSSFMFLGLLTITISCENTSGSDVITEDQNTTDSLYTAESETEVEILEEDKLEMEVIDSSLIDLQTDLSTKNFITNLKKGNNLSGFFADNWTFVYHENSRYDGNTDGKAVDLQRFKVDNEISLNVYTDGDGWEPNLESIGSKDIQFSLKNTTQEWDAFNTENIGAPEKNMVYISTLSQSEYLQVYYNNDKKIIKLIYNMVDPG